MKIRPGSPTRSSKLRAAAAIGATQKSSKKWVWSMPTAVRDVCPTDISVPSFTKYRPRYDAIERHSPSPMMLEKHKELSKFSVPAPGDYDLPSLSSKATHFLKAERNISLLPPRSTSKCDLGPVLNISTDARGGFIARDERFKAPSPTAPGPGTYDYQVLAPTSNVIGTKFSLRGLVPKPNASAAVGRELYPSENKERGGAALEWYKVPILSHAAAAKTVQQLRRDFGGVSDEPVEGVPIHDHKLLEDMRFLSQVKEDIRRWTLLQKCDTSIPI